MARKTRLEYPRVCYHLIKQVLSYAAGRHLEPADDYVVEEILQAVKADDYGLQTLVLEVIGSEIFRSR